MKTLALLLAATLAGCSATLVTSNPRSVTVKAVRLADAQPIADAACKKEGRFARFTVESERFIYVFDCVL